MSGWILKPFDLQVATMCGFDIVYDKPVLPSKVPQCKWITFRHDLEKIRFFGKSDIYSVAILLMHPGLAN